MKLIRIPKYQTPYGSVEFMPVDKVPGHSHRLVVKGEATDVWVPDSSRLDAKTVTFFVRVWGALRDGLPKYHYADKNIDPPVAPA